MRELALSSAPNPARARTDLRFALPTAGSVTLVVFDPAGRRVATVLDRQWLAAGPHSAALGTGSLKTGLYFARLEFGSQRTTRKFTVIR